MTTFHFPSDEVSRLSRELEQKDSQIGQLVEEKAKYEQV